MHIDKIKTDFPLPVQRKFMIVGTNGQSLLITPDSSEIIIRTQSQVRLKIFKSCVELFTKHMKENVGTYYTYADLTQIITPWFLHICDMKFDRIYPNDFINGFIESFSERLVQFNISKQEEIPLLKTEIVEPKVIAEPVQKEISNQHTLTLKAGRTLTVTYDGDLQDSEIELLSTYLRYMNK